jgi:hypothetical protein
VPAKVSFDRRLIESGVFVILFLSVALALTWPLALHLSTHVPLGSESATSVPNFNLWTLWWNVDRLPHAYQGYWNAPIFAPVEDAFGFSEPQFVTGLLAAPIWLVTRNIALAYNVVLLTFLSLNGVTAYILMRDLSEKAFPALLTGIVTQAVPFVAQELGVLQLTPLFGILLTLHFARRFAGSRALRDALGLGLSFAVTYLVTNYYALMLSLLLLGTVPFLIRREMLTSRSVTALLAGMALSAALLAPFVVQQMMILRAYHLERSAETIARNSAALADYARLPRATVGYRLWNARAVPGSGKHLYPGTALLLMGGWGLVTGLRRSEWRRWAITCCVGAILAFGLSFGPNLNTAGLGLPPWQPYDTLRAFYPGLRELRSPFRFGVFVQVFLALLAGLGMAAIHRNWQQSKQHWKLAVLLALLALTLVEVIPTPVRLMEATSRPDDPWLDWLADQPPGTVVAHVPFPTRGKVADMEPTSEWMLYQMWHGQPIANGYSGFSPPSYLTLRQVMHDFPNETSLGALQQRGVGYVLVEQGWLIILHREALDAWQACLEPVLDTPAVLVLRLTAAPGCPE